MAEPPVPHEYYKIVWVDGAINDHEN